MGRAPQKITKFPSDDPAVNRMQEHIAQVLNPILENPALGMSDWRFNQGPYPTQKSPECLLLQRRTAPDTWATVGAFDSTGAFTGSSGTSLGSILTTKGDLVAGLGAGSVSRLGVGTDGNVLTADAAQTTGMRWAAGSSSSSTLHDATGKVSKLWSCPVGVGSPNVGFKGTGTADSVLFGSGSQVVVSTLPRPFKQLFVGAGVASAVGEWWGGSTGGWIFAQTLAKFTARIKLLSVTNIANAFALCETTGSSRAFNNPASYVPTLGGTNAEIIKHVTVSSDSRVGGGNFVFGTGDGATANWITTGVSANLTDEFLLCIDLTTANTAKCTITNCTSLVATTVSLTTHLPPATTILGPETLSWNNQAGSQAGMLVEYVWMDQAA